MGRYWPLWVLIGFPLLLILLDASPVAPNFVFVMMGIPTLLGIWVIVGLWACAKSIVQLRKGGWRRALTCAALPIAILLVGFNFFPFIHFCIDAGDILHFAFCRQFYLKEIEATPSNGQPRLEVINLGGMSWSSRGYVYDEGDEVLLSPSSQSSGWKFRAQGTELSCGYYAQPFPGHFRVTQHWYLASFNC